MRICDHRYHRDQQRLHVALRFIRLEARTHTIRQWTGLSDDRIRKLYRSYLADACERPLQRHRGKSPQRVATFVRSMRARQESALLASLLRLLGLLPSAPRVAPVGGTLPSLQRAHLLCQAYEVYRGLIGAPLLSFEHALFLFSSLLAGEELTCAGCRDCSAVVVSDRWSLLPVQCLLCAGQVQELGRSRECAA